MATYHCIQTHYEHGIGDVRVVFVLSDTYNGLFATSGVQNVGIFELKSSKKDLELSAGISAQDELQITCNQYLIQSSAEQSAFELFYSARSASVRVYCAVFINLNTALNVGIEDSDFAGVVQPDMKGDSVTWSGVNYASNVSPSRIWNARAITFGDAVLNQFTPKELVEGKKAGTTTIVPPISSEWKEANVQDRLGWYHHTPSGTGVERKGVYNELVNLSTAIIKLRDQFQLGMANTGVSNYSVLFDDVEFDFEFAPSLPFNSDFPNYNKEEAGRLSMVWFANVAEPSEWGADVENLFSGNYNIGVYLDAFKPDLIQKRKLKLFTGSIDEQIYVHWRMFAPLKNEEKLSLASAGNFLEMLYAIAYSFGMLLETYNTNATTLRVRFISRKNLKKWRSYPIGATSDSVDLKYQSKEKGGVRADGSVYTIDGFDVYKYFNSNGNRVVSYLKQNSKAEGQKLPLSVSRSLAAVNSYWGSVLGGNIAQTRIVDCVPHNGSLIDWRDDKWNVLIKTAGISTALYMYSSVLPARMNPPDGGRYLTPVASVLAMVDGKQMRWDSMSAYINYMNGRAGYYYETERTIDVPFLCGFSRFQDGSNPSWKNIALGCEVVYDGVEYIVLGIERDYASCATKLRLQDSSRFSFNEVGTIIDGDDGDGVELPNPVTNDTASQQSGISSVYTSGGVIDAGDALMLVGDNRVARANANVDECYELVMGIALHGANSEERVSVALPDSRISCSRYEFTPMERVYVRTSESGELNISSELLTASSASIGENTIVEIGVAVAVNAIMLSTPTYIVREELI